MSRAIGVHLVASSKPNASNRNSEIDRLTLERCKRADAKAFRSFVVCYQSRVFAVLSRMLHQSQWANVPDLAQEVFLKVHSALPNFDLERHSKVSSWVLTIATRTAIDYLRKHSTWREELRDELPERVAQEKADMMLAQNELKECVQAALSQLPVEYRAALMLRTFHELSYQEIAETLEVDVGTVKSRISRSRLRLRELLSEQGYGVRHD